MRITVTDLKQMKQAGQKIAMLTAYDAPTARLLEEAGVPALLVGDSLGNVVLGYENTLPVTVEDMLRHTQAVVRATSRALVITDMPFLSFQVSPEQALLNAGRFIKEGGAQAVKLEGGAHIVDTVARLVRNGIPVMGHVGLTPQAVHQMGGYRVQGRDLAQARQVLEDAKRLEEAGAFALVLEEIPAFLARLITESLTIPTIGIGAGPYCDGQVQVYHDLVRMDDRSPAPRHAKPYANLAETIRAAVHTYIAEVQGGKFPTEEHSFKLPREVAEALRKAHTELGSG